MKKIALTGNIACGKSYAYELIKSKGYPIIDVDNIVKKIYEDDFVLKLLSVNFPEIMLNNKIDAQKLSKLIFNDKKAKRRLELIIHPLVRNEITEFFEMNQHTKNVFVVIPLLFEAQMENLFDVKVMILADKEIRKKRLVDRNSNLSQYADEVIASQMPDEEKAKLCDIVIYNNGTLDEFKCAVDNFINSL